MNLYKKLKKSEYVVFEDEKTRISITKKKSKYHVQVDDINTVWMGSIRSYKTYTAANNYTFSDKKIIDDIVKHYEFDKNNFTINNILTNHVMVY